MREYRSYYRRPIDPLLCLYWTSDLHNYSLHRENEEARNKDFLDLLISQKLGLAQSANTSLWVIEMLIRPPKDTFRSYKLISTSSLQLTPSPQIVVCGNQSNTFSFALLPYGGRNRKVISVFAHIMHSCFQFTINIISRKIINRI